MKLTITLEDFVLAHRHLYYTGEACISDSEYDLLESEALKVLDSDSPLHGAGGPSNVESVLKLAAKILKAKKALEEKYKPLGLT